MPRDLPADVHPSTFHDAMVALTAIPRVVALLCHARQALYHDGLITLDEYATLAAIARLAAEPTDPCRH